MPCNGTRVKVWKFINQKNPDEGYIGEGKLVGHVQMTEVMTKKEYKEAKRKFVSNVLKQMGMPDKGLIFEGYFKKHWKREQEIQPFEKQTTPKIILDSGEVVYGCQVWWKAIEEEGKT